MHLASDVDGLFNDHQKQKKAERVTLAKQYLGEPSDVSSLESPVHAITAYIESVGKEIELVKIGEDYYSNIPATGV